MGVGVFSSTFEGRGSTVLVSGTLCTREDYDAYRENFQGEDGDESEPMPYEHWARQECDDDLANLAGALQSLAESLGGTKAFLGRRAERADFDHDFARLGSDSHWEIGVRGWEHDHVVGVAVGGVLGAAMANPEGEAGIQAVLEFRATPAELSQRGDTLQDALAECVRFELMANGFDCRFKTSGYTSSAYTVPEDLPAAQAAAKAAVVAAVAAVQAMADRDLLGLDTPLRRELLKEAVAEGAGRNLRYWPLPIASLLIDPRDWVVCRIAPDGEGGECTWDRMLTGAQVAEVRRLWPDAMDSAQLLPLDPGNPEHRTLMQPWAHAVPDCLLVTPEDLAALGDPAFSVSLEWDAEDDSPRP